jgi:hypothetical protein
MASCTREVCSLFARNALQCEPPFEAGMFNREESFKNSPVECNVSLEYGVVECAASLEHRLGEADTRQKYRFRKMYGIADAGLVAAQADAQPPLVVERVGRVERSTDDRDQRSRTCAGIAPVHDSMHEYSLEEAALQPNETCQPSPMSAAYQRRREGRRHNVSAETHSASSTPAARSRRPSTSTTRPGCARTAHASTRSPSVDPSTVESLAAGCRTSNCG